MNSSLVKVECAEVESKARSVDAHQELSDAELDQVTGGKDRLSKMMSTLSNLLKKISDTANSITQNLK